MTNSPFDPSAMDALFRPGGRWAVDCGTNVKQRREILRISQDDLAEICDVRPNTIYRVERGQSVPSDRLRATIAFYLRTTPEELWPFPSAKELVAFSNEQRTSS